MEKISEKDFVATRNACKLCSPLGASLAFKGIEGCVPLIHGSQGCSTYIRRYLISHYKEPVDIASTNFTEQSAVFGGERNLFAAIDNVSKQYQPKIICVATTCLSETIGDDMQQLLHKYREQNEGRQIPDLLYVNTPSYRGTHANAFHDASLAFVKAYASQNSSSEKINLLPGFLSPADLRFLKDLSAEMDIESILLPDYSDTLDDKYTGEYERIPEGGTTISELKESGSSRGTIEFGYILNRGYATTMSAGEYLEKEFSVPRLNIGIPIGIKETDVFFDSIEKLSGKKTPEKHIEERGRLIDAYVDGHKYVFGKRAIVYGEEDFVIAMLSFLEEIGVHTVLCASGGNSGLLEETITKKVKPKHELLVKENIDFEDIAVLSKELKPEILIGNSKGYYIARELSIPLVRVGFPIHDRIGAQRIRHIGYGGTLEMFDRIANVLIEYKQENSPVGYKYV